MPIHLIELKYVSVERGYAEDLDEIEKYMREQWGLVQMTVKRTMTCKVCDDQYNGYSMNTHLQTKRHLAKMRYWKEQVDPLYGNSCEDCPCLITRFNGFENKDENLCRLGYAHTGRDLEERLYIHYDLGTELSRPQSCINTEDQLC